MAAILISIGDELLLGQTVDTNAAWLSAQLAARGVMSISHKVIPDNKTAIAACLAESADEAELIIVSGGLGPTPDDLTRDALADAMGVELVMDHTSLAAMESYFRGRELPMPLSNRKQAMVPEGAQALRNSCGTAPGLKAQLGRASVFVVPGVPSEMKAMFREHIQPELERSREQTAGRGRYLLALTINSFGCGESVVADKLGELMARNRNPLVGTTVSDGIISVRIRSEFKDDRSAVDQLSETARLVRERLGSFVFGEGEETLQQAVGALLLSARKTVATVESCTAGLLGKLLTDPPGASNWYLGGWIVYSDELKRSLLGVPASTLSQHGAVSEPVALFLAERGLRLSKADYSLAVTGIAGPSGSAPGKPVGTVWVALGRKTGAEVEARAERLLLGGSRETIRDRTAKSALNILRLELLELAAGGRRAQWQT